VHVLFSRTVDQMSAGDGLGRMYTSFLSHTTITSKKKTLLARRSLPTVLEDMGYVIYNQTILRKKITIVWMHRVSADQVDALGHWQGNTRREVYGSKIPKAVCPFKFTLNYIINLIW
jgi:hypothetical protein